MIKSPDPGSPPPLQCICVWFEACFQNSGRFRLPGIEPGINSWQVLFLGILECIACTWAFQTPGGECEFSRALFGNVFPWIPLLNLRVVYCSHYFWSLIFSLTACQDKLYYLTWDPRQCCGATSSHVFFPDSLFYCLGTGVREVVAGFSLRSSSALGPGAQRGFLPTWSSQCVPS